jgi:hypothetical protein
MNHPNQITDIPHEANLRLAFCIRQFNQSVRRFKNGWAQYVLPSVSLVALGTLGLAAWQSTLVSILLFCSGVAALLILSILRPYSHSPEYIYDNPTWAAFYASYYDYEPLRMDLLDETSEHWRSWITQHYKPKMNGSTEISLDILIIAILAEIIRSSDNVVLQK